MNKFTLEQKIVNKLILRGPLIQDLGLMYGKMGIILFFFEYGKYTACDVYTSIGEELIDDILGKVSSRLSFNFDSGLAGIGWGIEYLLQNHFIESADNDIFEEIDRAIMLINLRRLDNNTLDTGIEGIYYYISARMQSTAPNTPFDFDYLKDLSLVCPILKDRVNMDEFYNKYPLSLDYFLEFNNCIVDQNNYNQWELGLKNGLSGFLLKKILFNI